MDRPPPQQHLFLKTGKVMLNPEYCHTQSPFPPPSVLLVDPLAVFRKSVIDLASSTKWVTVLISNPDQKVPDPEFVLCSCVGLYRRLQKERPRGRPLTDWA